MAPLAGISAWHTHQSANLFLPLVYPRMALPSAAGCVSGFVFDPLLPANEIER
jgi:hypothetical protein